METNVYARRNVAVDEYQHYAVIDSKEVILDDDAYGNFLDMYHIMNKYNKDRGDNYITSISIDNLGNYIITHE